MENTVDSFVVYKSFYEAINNLEKQDDQLELYNAMFEYCLYGNEPNLTGVCSIMWTLIKPQLDSNIKRRIDGKKGGAPKGNNNAKKQPKTTIVDLENNHRLIQKQPNVNVNENVNVNVNENKRKFTTPTLSEVQEYFKANGYSNADKAFQFYNEANWHDSKGNKVKNWKQKMQGVWFKEENKIKIEAPRKLLVTEQNPELNKW
jgi:hypothetical protein